MYNDYKNLNYLLPSNIFTLTVLAVLYFQSITQSSISVSLANSPTIPSKSLITASLLQPTKTDHYTGVPITQNMPS